MQHDYVLVYHGTAEADLPSILKQGLVPAHGKGADQWARERHKQIAEQSTTRPPSVYVSKDRIFASEFAGIAAQETKSKPVVLRLHVPREVFATQFKEDEYSDPKPRNALEELLGMGTVVNYRSEQTVPASWIVGQSSTEHKGYSLAPLK